MWKWFLGILAVVVLLVALGVSVFVWVAMAGGLQQVVDDNLTLLKRNLILHDRELSFTYETYGVEPIGLSPAVTLSQPLLILKMEGVEYRVTAPEFSVIGSFTQLNKATLQAPEEVQVTVKKANNPPRIFKVNLPDNFAISVLAVLEESHLWEGYELSKAISGKVKVKDTNTGAQQTLNYTFPATGLKQLVPPYSKYLLPALKKVTTLGKNL